MIDPNKYIASDRAGEKKALKVGFVWMAFVFGWLETASRQQDWLKSRFGENWEAAFLFLQFMVIVGSALFGQGKLLSRWRLKCPACGKIPQTPAGWAIASRKCPHCATRILGAASSEDDKLRVGSAEHMPVGVSDHHRPTLSLEERMAAVKAHEVRLLVVFAISLASCALLVLIAAILLPQFRPQLAQHIGEVWLELLPTLCVSALCLTVFIFLFRWARRATWCDKRLACPHCGRQDLSVVALRLTGNCPRCGGRVTETGTGNRATTESTLSGPGCLIPLRRFVAVCRSQSLGLVQVAFGGFGFFAALFLFVASKDLARGGGESAPFGWTLKVTAWLVLIAAVAAIVWRLLQVYRRTIECPNCRKPLGQYAQVVIATRNCGCCGQRVLSET